MSNNSNSQEEENLEFIEDLILHCPEHKNTIIGVCGELLCKENRVYCLKCVKDKITTCFNESNINPAEVDETTSNPHPLISISELITTFFVNQSSKEFDLSEFNNMIEVLKNVESDDIKQKSIDYLNYTEEIYSNLIDTIKTSFASELENINLEYVNELDTIEKKYVNELSEPEIKKLKIDFPKIVLDKSYKRILQDCTTEIGDDMKKIHYHTIVNCLNHFEDTDKINSELCDVENILYISKLKEISESDKKFEEKIIILEEKLNLILKETENLLFPQRKEVLYYIKDPQTKFESNPNDLVFYKNICENAHKSNSIDCVFTCFKSFKSEYVAVWGTPLFTLEAYNLVLGKVILSKVAHTSTIFTCRHYPDKKNKTDLIITSSYDKSVKVWNFNENFKITVNIPNAHTGYYIYSACLLISELDGNMYEISSAPNEYSKLWNFLGKHLNDFGVSNQSTYFISNWFDSKNKQYYIINANSADVKVYNFKGLSLYKTFKTTPNTWHMSAHVVEKKDKTFLIESDGSGNVRSWDFFTGILLSTVSSAGVNLRGICIWNDQFVISSGSDSSVKIYDVENSKLTKSIVNHNSTVCSVLKIYIPKLGECLISHALDGKLKLYANPKNISLSSTKK